jgi:hypothetical protein
MFANADKQLVTLRLRMARKIFKNFRCRRVTRMTVMGSSYAYRIDLRKSVPVDSISLPNAASRHHR